VHIPTTTRRGFGAANNLGAARARGDYLWLLNSDTIVPDGRINELFPLLDRNPTTGLLSPMLFSDHTLTRTQSDFYAHFQSLPSLLTRRPRPNIDWNTQQHRDLILTDLIVAAAMVVRTDLFRKLGGFDERYFMYMEDDDLCYRARKLGWQAAITPKAAVVHLQGKSISRSRERKQFYYASEQLFWKTHYGW
jgi:GT2 family glycosyltransferase